MAPTALGKTAAAILKRLDKSPTGTMEVLWGTRGTRTYGGAQHRAATQLLTQGLIVVERTAIVRTDDTLEVSWTLRRAPK